MPKRPTTIPEEAESTPWQQASGSLEIGSSIEDLYEHINVGQEVFKAAELQPEPPTHKVRKQAGAPASRILLPAGIGLFIWQLELCEDGDPKRIASRAAETGLSHVVIKVADGTKAYGVKEQIVAVCRALKKAGVQAWGWHYLYGSSPKQEGQLAARLIKEYRLQGYILDVEHEFKSAGAAKKISQFYEALGTPAVPLGICSYRNPSYHDTMPWKTLLAKANFIAPQVYWEQAHNPGAQLERSLLEYAALEPRLTILPIGSAYSMGDWAPTAGDLAEFIETARARNLPGVSFFAWDWLGQKEQQALWDVLTKVRWEALPAAPQAKAEAGTRPEPSASPLPPEPVEQTAEAPAAVFPSIPAPSFERKYVPIVHNDEVENAEDRLGFDQYAEALVSTLLDERTSPPLTVGISAAWGSGKSFLLQRVRMKIAARAEQDPRLKGKIHAITFNAWDYNTAENTWTALVRNIFDKMEAHSRPAWRIWNRVLRNMRRQWAAVKEKVIPLVAIVLAVAIVLGFAFHWDFPALVATLAALGITGIVSNLGVIASQPVATWIINQFTQERAYGSMSDYNQEIREDILALQKGLPPGAKIVIFIDDLDRCSSKKIVEVLEAIKLLLPFNLFIVFLAIDSGVIARAIENEYKNTLPESTHSGYFYLDKIIQIPFRIPPPAPQDVINYLFGLLSPGMSRRAPMSAEKAEELTDAIHALISRSAARNEILEFIFGLPDTPEEAATIIWQVSGQLATIRRAAAAAGDEWSKEDRRNWIAVVWTLLASHWPVSTYLIHENLNSKMGPQEIAAIAEQPVLSVLVEQAAQNADIKTQQVLSQVDSSTELIEQLAKRGPKITIRELLEVLRHWTTPYPVTIQFSEAEKSAFQRLLAFIKKNPRHIKKLVNTYSLIRLLASRMPEGRQILNAPEAVLKWLIIASQWPLTAEAILEEFNNEIQAAPPGGASLKEDDDALARLYEKACRRIKGVPELVKEREHLDGDLDDLDHIIQGITTISTSQLSLLKTYTINFNPAEDVTALNTVRTAAPAEK